MMRGVFVLLLTASVLGSTVQNQPRGKGKAASDLPEDKKDSSVTSDGTVTMLKQSRLSLGLFKNGYAFFVKTFKVDGDGSYQLDLPDLSHGTFAMSSKSNVSLSAHQQTRDIPEPVNFASLSRANLQETLAGQSVTFRLQDTKDEVTGTVIKPAACPAGTSCKTGGEMIAIQDASGGVTVVDPSLIVSFKFQSGNIQTTKSQTITTVSVEGTNGASTEFQVSYLAFGLTWAPAYQIDLRDQQLRIEFQATIRNEGAAIDAQDVSLITGYPSLEFMDSPSLFDNTMRDFLQGAGSNSYNTPRREIFSQSVMSNAYGVQDSFETAKIESDGSDIFYYKIGALALPANSAVMKSVEVGFGSFQHVIDWDASTSDAWDAIRFSNPLKSAMTTAPATVTEKASLIGQSSSKWTPPRGTAVIKVSKALSVRVSRSEVEGDGVNVGNDNKVVRVLVTGALTISNLRTTPTTACISYTFDGVLQSNPQNANASMADGGRNLGGPSSTINPRTSLNWEKPLPASSKLEISYTYNQKKSNYYG